MILVTTPGNVGHEATRLLAHGPAGPQPGQGRRVAGLAFSPATGISPLQSASLPRPKARSLFLPPRISDRER